MEPYLTLKHQLVQRTQLSEQRHLKQLLTTEELGDRTPTQLLRKMQQLLGDNAMDESLFCQLFEQHLPSNVRMVLASFAASMLLEEVAAMADRIMEVSVDARPHLHALKQASLKPNDDRLIKLEQQLASLTEAVERLANNHHKRFRGHSRHRSVHRRESQAHTTATMSESTAAQPTQPGLCLSPL